MTRALCVRSYGLLRVPCCFDRYGGLGLLPVQMDLILNPFYTGVLLEELAFVVYFAMLALYRQTRTTVPAYGPLLLLSLLSCLC